MNKKQEMIEKISHMRTEQNFKHEKYKKNESRSLMDGLNSQTDIVKRKKSVNWTIDAKKLFNEPRKTKKILKKKQN